MLISIEGEDVHLVIGVPLNHRLTQILESGAKPVIISKQPIDTDLKVISKDYDENDLFQDDIRVDRVFVTSSDQELIEKVFKDCKKLKIPINVTDKPEFSTFTILNTYVKGSLQIGVTTTGKGCKLSSKIKRHLISSLPPNMEDIITNVSNIRQQIKDIDNEDIEEDFKNPLVKEFEMTDEDKKKRRSRWLSQIIEYYPLEKLADISLNDLERSPSPQPEEGLKKGTISLVGAGPGSPDLLTTKAVNEILTADFILTDKLVPAQVLDLIPKKTPIFVAKKYPGNAEQAQQELLEIGLSKVSQGLKVIRLKQGDPYIFGRGGEEFKYFTERGYKVDVVPGITSALSAPMVADIPVTHRDVADQVLICTGTGRRGALPQIPEFVKSRTTIFLMSLHRSKEFVACLEQNGWPMDLPSCIVERANCVDERVTRCKLGDVHETMERIGSRPPGLLITGFACDILSSLSLK
ncbi:uroporphyrinogen-III C-methyltransferase [[Candida] jaroonii]|uniref:Uroporphyrinogen-III C-methyltransferase n=1 Tax=[Candida] jaroonii TaxID=467808 RepID=A0ACA9Y977_9ASCO|nr:uroporphyrinogen-III C-methyltransferase [[Candida] jaroonii]